MANEKSRKKRGAAAKTERPRRVADAPVGEADALGAGVKSPVTETGQSVERQIRKEWDPKKRGGLPTLLRAGGR